MASKRRIVSSRGVSKDDYMQHLLLKLDNIVDSASGNSTEPLELDATALNAIYSELAIFAPQNRQKLSSLSESGRGRLASIRKHIVRIEELRITSIHKSGKVDMLSSVDLSPFQSLTRLQLYAVKPSIISNLSAIAPKLTSIVVREALHALDELLDVRDNYSTSYVEEQHMWGRLNTLDLANNSIPAIDPSMRMMKNVQTIILSNNIITAIHNLDQCSALQVLDLSFNQIKSLDNIFRVIGNIRVLRLSDNQISSTSGLEKLLSLEELDLANNNIAGTADIHTLSRLPLLKKLLLVGNPVSYSPKYWKNISVIFSSSDSADEPVEVDGKPVDNVLHHSPSSRGGASSLGEDILSPKDGGGEGIARTSSLRDERNSSVRTIATSKPGNFLAPPGQEDAVKDTRANNNMASKQKWASDPANSFLLASKSTPSIQRYSERTLHEEIIPISKRASTNTVGSNSRSSSKSSRNARLVDIEDRPKGGGKSNAKWLDVPADGPSLPSSPLLERVDVDALMREAERLRETDKDRWLLNFQQSLFNGEDVGPISDAPLVMPKSCPPKSKKKSGIKKRQSTSAVKGRKSERPRGRRSEPRDVESDDAKDLRSSLNEMVLSMDDERYTEEFFVKIKSEGGLPSMGGSNSSSFGELSDWKCILVSRRYLMEVETQSGKIIMQIPLQDVLQVTLSPTEPKEVIVVRRSEESQGVPTLSLTRVYECETPASAGSLVDVLSNLQSLVTAPVSQSKSRSSIALKPDVAVSDTNSKLTGDNSLTKKKSGSALTLARNLKSSLVSASLQCSDAGDNGKEAIEYQQGVALSNGVNKAIGSKKLFCVDVPNSLRIRMEGDLKLHHDEKILGLWWNYLLIYGAAVDQEVPVLTVLTSSAVYTVVRDSPSNQQLQELLRHQRARTPAVFLTRFPLDDATGLVAGLFHQYIRFEFGRFEASIAACTPVDSSTFACEKPFAAVFVFRAQSAGRQFFKFALSAVNALRDSTQEKRVSPQQFNQPIVSKINEEVFKNRQSDGDVDYYNLVTVRQSSGMKPRVLILSKQNIYLCTEDYGKWPFPEEDSPPMKQFTDVEHATYQVILGVERKPLSVVFVFEEEVRPGVYNWEIEMEDEESVASLVERLTTLCKTHCQMRLTVM